LTIGYGAGGHVASITDRLGHPTVFGYDGSGEHLMTAQYYDGRIASYAYTGSGNLQSITYADGARAECAYDLRGNLTNATAIAAGGLGSSADFQSAVSQVSNLSGAV
jgi:YD repeat-containing protein